MAGMMEIRRRILANTKCVPPSYEICDWLEGSGRNARIDTGVTGNDETLRIFCEFMPIEISGSYNAVFGNYKTESDHYCWRCITKATTSSDYYYAFYVNMGHRAPSQCNTMTPFRNDESMINQKVKIDMSYGSVTVTGSVTSTYSNSPTQKTANTNNIAIGSLSAGSGNSATNKFRYYAFKMWSHGVLVRNYIPCVRKSDNKAGFYDTVNHTFNPSIGSVDFTAGND